MSQALIALRDAAVHFGKTEALSGVNLAIQRGERIALVGANGSGKTTLLRALNGLLPLRQGQRALPGGALNAAMLFQKPFHLRLSVANNLRLALWLAGVPAAERFDRTEQALQRVGLAALAQRPARELSGGQQQRLALARAWARQPQVLFLDEPTASLDPSAKREVETLVEQFADAGMTVVMSTHNLGQAKRLARRVLYLDAGRLAADLPVQAFFDPSATHAAAAFLKGELAWA
jgi:tungstate transport system ATP-binding protein